MNQRGFQMLDVMIVLVFVGWMAVLGLGLTNGLVQHQHLQGACDLFVSQLQRARQLAITKNLGVRLWVEDKRFGLGLDDSPPARWTELPASIHFADQPSRPVIFRSRGTAAPAGSYTLEGPTGQLRVIVAVSGRARWERVP